MIRLIKKLLDDPHYPKETLEELQRDLKEMSPEKILKQAMDIIKEFCVRYEVLNVYAHIVVQFEKGRSTVIAPCVLSERDTEWEKLNALILIVDLKNQLLKLSAEGKILI